MYAHFEKGITDSFSKKSFQLFSDIDTIAVSIPERYLQLAIGMPLLLFQESAFSLFITYLYISPLVI